MPEEGATSYKGLHRPPDRRAVPARHHQPLSGAMADFYAPDVVIEMPFAPAGLYPSRTETSREELRTRFRAGAAVRRYTGLA